jgi:predicted flap endonuclease-1-like 5' DNA nuclease
MNKPIRNMLRVAGIAIGVGAAVWAMRDKLLPAPNIPEEPPPRFRTGPVMPVANGGGDDLTEIKGIGPVYASRLAQAGIATFATLAAATPAIVAEGAGVSEAVAAAWIEQAAASVLA